MPKTSASAAALTWSRVCPATPEPAGGAGGCLARLVGEHPAAADALACLGDGDDEHGRGLMIVRALAADWGVTADGPHQRTVWVVTHS